MILRKIYTTILTKMEDGDNLNWIENILFNWKTKNAKAWHKKMFDEGTSRIVQEIKDKINSLSQIDKDRFLIYGTYDIDEIHKKYGENL